MWTRLCETRARIMAARQRSEKEMHRLESIAIIFGVSWESGRSR